jgi:hypothetical protein
MHLGRTTIIQRVVLALTRSGIRVRFKRSRTSLHSSGRAISTFLLTTPFITAAQS